MNARSALFDLYGDHLRARGGSAPVAALVRALGALDVAAPAVRTAVSRMVRQGWLIPVRDGQGPGYALTPKATRRLDDAAGRIYRTHRRDWDGRWHLLVLDHVRDRSTRERLRGGLGYLGYGAVSDLVWVAARPSPELDALLDTERIRAERFTATHDGDTAALVGRVWDLEALSRAYTRWLAEAEEMVAATAADPAPVTAFAVRSRLVHEWRKFLFRDPALPPELLPGDWAGAKAATYFDAESSRLLPAATAFVDRCLEPAAQPMGGTP